VTSFPQSDALSPSAADIGRSSVTESDATPSVHAFAVAPMMEMTDRYCRYFHHLLAPQALLYSEMVTTNAIIHGDREHLLGFDQPEGAVAPVLQLGGSDPAAMARCALVGQQFGYQQINMNVGCPSDRVQSGRFGACLMAEPSLVADCVAAMQAAVDVPVTVKCRIGIDRDDSYDLFAGFVGTVAAAGCDTFIVHARKAWLDGLSPKENRELPPLRYEFVQRIKAEMPDITFVLNGGLRCHRQSLSFIHSESPALDGVMWGREAYRSPWQLNEVDSLYYGASPVRRTRFDLVEAMFPYIEANVVRGVPLGRITRHMLGLFQAQPGGRLWRRHLSENAWKNGAGVEVVAEALGHVERAASKAA
jgi:tRNA-dihydrouridine synthase A